MALFASFVFFVMFSLMDGNLESAETLKLVLFFEQKLTCWPVCGVPPLSQSHSVDDITAD